MVLWLGSIVGCALKLSSPHPRAVAFIFSALVGAFGGLVGLFVARMLGVARDDSRTLAIVSMVSAAAWVLLYAFTSRAVHGWNRRHHRLRRDRTKPGHDRSTRPTIVF